MCEAAVQYLRFKGWVCFSERRAWIKWNAEVPASHRVIEPEGSRTSDAIVNNLYIRVSSPCGF